MQWSKLKSRVKSFICPELRDRIDFHLTSYRELHHGADKVRITVGGQRVLSCKHYPHEWAEAEAHYGGLRGGQVKEFLREKEIQGPKDFGDAMRAYLDMPIREALESADPFVKAFALVDRRAGKRALEKLEISDSGHTLVKDFYGLRRSSTHT